MDAAQQGALDFGALAELGLPSAANSSAARPARSVASATAGASSLVGDTLNGSPAKPHFRLTQSDAVEWLNQLAPESVDLVITDPPYESLEKHRAIGTTTRLKHSKSSSNDWFRIFPNARFPELFAAVYRVLKRNTHFYLFCDQETMFVAKPLAESAGFRFWKPLVWDKCIAPDTPVWTTEGVVRADELKPGDRVATPDGRDVAVLATRTTRSPVVRVALSDGTSIVCSTDHRLATSTGEVVEAGTLKPGATLAFADLPLSNAQSSVSLDQLVDEDERVLELADPSCCLFCGREFDSVRAAAAHQARFCEAARSKEAMAIAIGVAPKRLRRWLTDGRLPAAWARQLGLAELATGRSRFRLQNDSAPWFPESIRLDYALGKTIGLYAAEGNRNDLSVCFALHQDEKHLQNHISRVARSLGLKAVVDETTEHGCVVRVCSKLFSALIGAFVGGHDAATKYLTKRALQTPPEFLRGMFDGLIEGDGHWSHDEQRETYTTASLDLACFVLRFARQLGWNATIRRFENSHRGGWRVRFDPGQRTAPLSVVSVETGDEMALVDIAIDDPAQLYVLGNGVVSHNCKIGMGYHYRARYEFILFFEKGKRKLNNLGIPDVIAHPRILNGYPTEKPMEVSRVLVEQSSSPDELVVDPFMGSGSVGVAALSAGRRFRGADVAETALRISTERLGALAQK